MIKKYKENKNIAGPLIKESRKKVHMTKAELCKKLELQRIKKAFDNNPLNNINVRAA